MKNNFIFTLVFIFSIALTCNLSSYFSSNNNNSIMPPALAGDNLEHCCDVNGEECCGDECVCPTPPPACGSMGDSFCSGACGSGTCGLHPLGGCCCSGGTCGDGTKNCSEGCETDADCSWLGSYICSGCTCIFAGGCGVPPNCRANGSTCTKTDGSMGSCMSLPGSSCQCQ